MANSSASAIGNVTIQSLQFAIVFAKVFFTVNIVIFLSEFYAKRNLTSDQSIGLMMALMLTFSKVLFDGT